MPTQHREDRTAAGRGRYLIDDVAKLLSGQDCGQRVDERIEGAIGGLGCVGEQRSIDFVVAFGYGDSFEAGEVGFAVIGHYCAPVAPGTTYSLSFSVTWPNEKFD